jgi:hypothetical protein
MRAFADHRTGGLLGWLRANVRVLRGRRKRMVGRRSIGSLQSMTSVHSPQGPRLIPPMSPQGAITSTDVQAPPLSANVTVGWQSAGEDRYSTSGEMETGPITSAMSPPATSEVTNSMEPTEAQIRRNRENQVSDCF